MATREPDDLNDAPTMGDPGKGETLRPGRRKVAPARDLSQEPTLREGARSASSSADPRQQLAGGEARLRVGQPVFGRYLLQKVLGRGGMGIVWLAQDKELDRLVALKMLPEAVAYNEAALEDLKRETRRALELTHPHIVRIHNFERDDDLAGIAMEYVDGPNLATLRAREATGAFEVAGLREYVRQLCEALEYAHTRGGVVHRDLKPLNLMVNSRNELKVADFGISRSLTDSLSRLTHGGASGTLAYMSPQQLRGERARVEDDIYALGATLYELLTSKPPFWSGDLSSQIKEQTPPSMEDRRRELELERAGGIPTAWEETVAACLAKRPENRPGSARIVAQRLGLIEAGLASVPEVVAPTPAPKSGGRKKERRPASEPVEAAESVPPVVAGERLINSQKMPLVKVPGTEVWFSVWPVRVQDFQAFAKAARLDWPEPGFAQEPTHPAVNVSWEEARKFCRWLTREERKQGRLTDKEGYRLPEDLEWSAAVGLAPEGGKTPQERDFGVQGVYPWGKAWPPPKEAGNYDPSLKVDRFERTSPVGSFAPNATGLFDLGGNVWEWCADWYGSDKEGRVLRGGAWDTGTSLELLSSYRGRADAGTRQGNRGFRYVLDRKGTSGDEAAEAELETQEAAVAPKTPLPAAASKTARSQASAKRAAEPPAASAASPTPAATEKSKARGAAWYWWLLVVLPAVIALMVRLLQTADTASRRQSDTPANPVATEPAPARPAPPVAPRTSPNQAAKAPAPDPAQLAAQEQARREAELRAERERERLRQQRAEEERILKEREAQQRRLEEAERGVASALEQGRVEDALEQYSVLQQGDASRAATAAEKLVSHVAGLPDDKAWERAHYAWLLAQKSPQNAAFQRLASEKRTVKVGELSVSTGRQGELQVKDITGRMRTVTVSNVAVTQKKRIGLLDGRTDVVAASCEVQVDGSTVRFAANKPDNQRSLVLSPRSVGGLRIEAAGRYSKSAPGVLEVVIGVAGDAVSLGQEGFTKEFIDKGKPYVMVDVFLDP